MRRALLLLELVCIAGALLLGAAAKDKAEEVRLDAWLETQGLNRFGDPPGKMYAGGTPLFNMMTGELSDRVVHVARKFPARPWNDAAAAAGGEGDEPAAPDGGDVPPTYPPHWGDPPLAQTRDYRPLPGGYGFGSSTLARWIEKHLEEDEASSSNDAK